MKRALIDTLQKDFKQALEEDVDRTYPRIVGFTTDGWSAPNMEQFISLTVHYIDEDFNLKMFALACRGFSERHTGAMIARELDLILKEYPLLESEKIVKVAVTDAAANQGAAIRNSKHFSAHHICMDHVLNTCLELALKSSEEVMACLAKGKQLAKRCNQSSADLSTIGEACNVCSGKISLVLLKSIKFKFVFWKSCE